jgi:site-specific DNA-methyltransferase (adenine-specific)
MAEQVGLRLGNRNPDVLTCIANLSNDEVFTPPELANQMLDLVADAWADAHGGASIWADPSVRFLDPFTKSGVFLREITKRLTDGLTAEIPDLEQRVDHILTQQVFGIAITRLTSLIARRSLYCSKWANGKHSIARSFQTEQGNIWFEPLEHSWVGATEFIETADAQGRPVRHGTNGRCTYCGASQSTLDRGSALESHAYAFIHTDDIQARIAELFGDHMHFDVIIGNPPYQIDDEGGHRPVPLYQKFVGRGKDLDPRFLVMVTPSRWMAGGLGLGAFRAEMLSDSRIRALVDYPVSRELFPGVEIKGGVSYFLWSRDHNGLCSFSTVRDGITSGPVARSLDEHDILVRDTRGLSLLQRVTDEGAASFETMVASVRPFGDRLRSNFKDFLPQATAEYSTPLLVNSEGRRVEVWTKPSYLTANHELAAGWKLFLPKAGSDGGQRLPNPVIGTPRIGRPGQISTETYLAIGPFKSNEEAQVALAYLQTRIARYLISLRKISQDNVPSTFRWLPVPDFSRPVTDASLKTRYSITDEEMAHIEAMVAQMDLDATVGQNDSASSVDLADSDV